MLFTTACALLIGSVYGQTYSATMGVYPGYNTSAAGAFTTSGTVGVTAAGTSLTLAIDLTGADSACPQAGQCGVHIHTGTSCSDASTVGGHFYATATDPWSAVTPYTSGTPSTITVDANLTINQVVGRAIVAHGASGTRLACGLIVSSPSPPANPPSTSGTAATSLSASLFMLLAIYVRLF